MSKQDRIVVHVSLLMLGSMLIVLVSSAPKKSIWLSSHQLPYQAQCPCGTSLERLELARVGAVQHFRLSGRLGSQSACAAVQSFHQKKALEFMKGSFHYYIQLVL